MKFKREAEKLYSDLEEKEVEGKKQYFKKRRVYPIINKDGSVNWFNFLTTGSIFKFGLILFIVMLSLGLIFEYSTNLKVGAECIARENTLNNLSAWVNRINNLPLD